MSRFMRFYPSDWRSEPTLKLVSRAARSLWIDILGLMHDADSYRLEINGRPMTERELCNILGDNPRTIRVLLAELEQAQVFDRDEEQFVVSRRLKRARIQAELAANWGRMGGNPNLKSKTYEDRGLTPIPEARSQKPEVYGGGGEREAQDDPKTYPKGSLTDREMILQAIGLDDSGMTGKSETRIGNAADMAEVERWLQLPGITMPLVLDEIRIVMAKKRDGPPSSFKFFTKAMQRLSGALSQPPLNPIAPPPAKGPRHGRKQFDAALNHLADQISAGNVAIDHSDRDPFAKRSR